MLYEVITIFQPFGQLIPRGRFKTAGILTVHLNPTVVKESGDFLTAEHKYGRGISGYPCMNGIRSQPGIPGNPESIATFSHRK